MRYFVLIVLLALMGCDKLEDRTRANPGILPPNATNVEYLKGSNWGKFTLDGKTVYFTYNGQTYQYIVIDNINFPQTAEQPIDGHSQIECPNCHSKIGIIATPLKD